jgi:hypothetical protein
LLGSSFLATVLSPNPYLIDPCRGSNFRFSRRLCSPPPTKDARQAFENLFKK